MPSLRSGVFLVTFILALVSGQAIAAKPPTPTEQAWERQAKTSCLSGDYAKGVAILAELFVETNNPVYLFNQGRCYEQNLRYAEAAERFREYLRKARDLTEDEKTQVDKFIAECDAAIAKSQSHPPVSIVPAPVPQPVTVSTVQEPSPPPQNPTVQVPLATPPALEHPWQHTAKWVATGAAVAFLGLGVLEHVRYYSKNKDYNNDRNCTSLDQCKGLADAADTAQIVSILGYSAAAASTGLAIWFWLTDVPRERTAPAVGVSFTCTPTLAGAACGGRF